VADSFNTEARCFIREFDLLGLEAKADWDDVPEEKLLRPVLQHAGWFRDQVNNPGIDFDIPQRLVIALGVEVLFWAAAPTQPRWERLFNARSAVRQCEDYFQRHE
jgi:hypothetical protein